MTGSAAKPYIFRRFCAHWLFFFSSEKIAGLYLCVSKNEWNATFAAKFDRA